MTQAKGDGVGQRKGGLGRGLDALIQSRDADDEQNGIRELDIDSLAPNPFQPRSVLDKEQLESLTASVREHGVIQPILITHHDGDTPYIIIAGERRWRAAQNAGLDYVPVVIRESTPRTMLEIAIIENVQRADLTVIEEAQAYRQLIEDFGLTQENVAKRVGKSRTAVTNLLRILDAPADIRQAVIDRQISEGHARALLGIPEDERKSAALQVVISRHLSVRQTEQLVREWREHTPKESDESQPADPRISYLENRFRDVLGTKVELRKSRSGGRLVIHYFSDEELDGLYHQIIGKDDL